MTGDSLLFDITPSVLNLVAEISSKVVKAAPLYEGAHASKMNRSERIRTVYSSLAIENGPLSLREVSDFINGRPVSADANDLREVRNIGEVYDMIPTLDPGSMDDFLRVHGVLMDGILDGAGAFRTGSEVVIDGAGNILYSAPGPEMVPKYMENLFGWLGRTEYHPLIKSSIFHYELEDAHPFEDGNGRMGRLWQTLILSKWEPIMMYVSIEDVINTRKQQYYRAIEESRENGRSTMFLEFMLGVIRDALDETEVRRFAGLANRPDSLSDIEYAVYSMIRDGEFGTAANASAALGVVSRTVERALRKLVDAGMIARLGSNRSGRWVLTD